MKIIIIHIETKKAKSLKVFLEIAVNPTKQLTLERISKTQPAIPIPAGLYNLKGLVYNQLKDFSGPNRVYTKALGLEPEYILAKTNLEA